MRTPIHRLTGRLPGPWRHALDWAFTVAVAVAIVMGVQAEVAKPFAIPTASMEPTLQCARPTPGCTGRFSDRIVADRLTYRVREPERGDIVVFQTPPLAERLCQAGGVYVKRLVGLPGERIEERDGILYVDGGRLAEPYVRPERRDTITRSYGRVPTGRYFFMGDNRRSSCDSRTWGGVPRDDLIGPVRATYWPLNRVSVR